MKGYSNAGELYHQPNLLNFQTLLVQTLNLNSGEEVFILLLNTLCLLFLKLALCFVAFAEAGTVLDDYDSFLQIKLNYDVGFGFR